MRLLLMFISFLHINLYVKISLFILSFSIFYKVFKVSIKKKSWLSFTMHGYIQWPLVFFNIRPMYLRYFFKGAMHDSSEVFRKKMWRIKLLPFSFIATKIFYRFHSRTPMILLLLWYAWSHLVLKFVFWKVCVFLKKDFSFYVSTKWRNF